MSAETLRQAAAAMRERAEAADEGPWEYDGQAIGGDLGTVAATGLYENGEHIASWHPAVALAVADWLDDTATTHRSEVDEVAREDCERCGPDDDCKGHDEECCWHCVGQWEEYAVRVFYPCRETKAALTVARAYLGEQP